MSGRSAFFTRSVRVDRWSFCEEAITAKAELYDLLRDPEERSNLVSDSDQKAVVAELRCIINGNQEGNLFRVSRGLE